MSHSRKPLVLALGAAVAASVGGAQASVFEARDLGTGYMQVAHNHAKAAEQKCGEGKCGEGRCGGSKPAQPDAPKAPEAGREVEKKTDAKCGEGKCGEGKCGGKPTQ